MLHRQSGRHVLNLMARGWVTMSLRRHIAGGIARGLLPSDLHERLESLHFADLGHGYDAFGAHRDWVRVSLALTRWLYDTYFRVTSRGAEHIPESGAAILASNHSGTIPIDGTMLYCDVVSQTNPPRLPRPVADVFVPKLPFVSTFFARVGVVAGSRRNVEALLERGELLMVFPEGVPGIGKRFRERYQLQHWRGGHAELAIRYQAPIIPVAIIGAEEQMPQIARINGIRVFGAPYLPIPLTPFPLPVHYYVYYGEPLALHDTYSPDQSDDPVVIREAAETVKAAVQRLIERGLEQRRGVFA